MDLPTERKDLLEKLFKQSENDKGVLLELEEIEVGLSQYDYEVYNPVYVEFLEKQLYSFIRTECNLNFINRLIKEVSLMEEEAKETSYILEQQEMISSSMCSQAMATAYRLVINKLKHNIR